MLIESIMTTQLQCVAPDTDVGEIRTLLTRFPFHHVPVLQEGRLVGIISDRDLLRNLSPYTDSQAASEQDQALLRQPASQIMSTRLITAQPDTLVDTAAILLLENNISCLPVINPAEDLVGIVTWKDMLKFYVYA